MPKLIKISLIIDRDDHAPRERTLAHTNWYSFNQLLDEFQTRLIHTNWEARRRHREKYKKFEQEISQLKKTTHKSPSTTISSWNSIFFYFTTPLTPLSGHIFSFSSISPSSVSPSLGAAVVCLLRRVHNDTSLIEKIVVREKIKRAVAFMLCSLTTICCPSLAFSWDNFAHEISRFRSPN